MKKCLTAALVTAGLVLAAAAPATAAGSSPSPSASGSTTQLQKVSAYVEPSIVYEQTTYSAYIYDTHNHQYLNKNGNPVQFTESTFCTGYVVNSDGYIATAGHCVDPTFVESAFYQQAAQWALKNHYFTATYLTLKDVLNFGIFQVRNGDGQHKPDIKPEVAWSVSAGGVQTGKALPARIIKAQKFDQGDGAILKVEATDLNALPISNQSIDVGTELVAVGYPDIVDNLADQSFTPTYMQGSISTKKTVSGGLLNVYGISAATTHGMSGGPAVNLDGQVIGFVSYGDPRVSNFNFIRPTEQINELLGDAGTTNSLSTDTKNYRAGLDAYFAGDRTTAVSKLNSVVNNQPTNEFAAKYLNLAKKLPQPKSSHTGLIIGIIVALLVIALVVGLVIFLLTRGRKKGGAAPVATGAPYAPPPAAGPPPGYQPPPGPATAATATTSTAVLDQPPAPGTAPAAPPAAPTAAPAQDAEPIFCANCGTKAEPGQHFCKHCGATLI